LAAHFAAQISCILARSGAYLPVVEGPRLTGPDRDAEIVRRNNAVALASAAEGREDALKNNASQEGPCACAGRKWNTPKKNADKKGHGW
jgi:hypothetical protein